MKLAAFLLASLSAVWALSAPAPAAAGAQPDVITVIGDSVLTAVQWNAQPRSILEHGFPSVDLEIAVCRRLTGTSCPFEGERPENLVDTVQSLGDAIGATVVVEVGYNDPETGFADAVDASVQALLAAGVQRILWVNYHDFVPRYARMNAVLARVAEKYPEVTVVDWQQDSFIRYSWFQSDGVHLVLEGAVALATLIHDALVAAIEPLRIVAPVRPVTVVQVGSSFSTRLVAGGGEGPYRWRVTGGPLARGLHLLGNGVLTGTPTKPGRYTISLVVSDSAGESVPLLVRLTVEPRAPR
jgi:hypothetical protein